MDKSTVYQLRRGEHGLANDQRLGAGANPAAGWQICAALALGVGAGAGGVVLPAFSLVIVMDGGARSGHLVGLAAEG